MGNTLGEGYSVENLDVRNVMERDAGSVLVHKGHPAVMLGKEMDMVLTGDGDAEAVDGLYYILKKDDLKNLNGMLRRQLEPEPEEPPYKDIWADFRRGNEGWLQENAWGQLHVDDERDRYGFGEGRGRLWIGREATQAQPWGSHPGVC